MCIRDRAAGDAKEESRQDGTAGESPEDTANQASGDTILIGVSGSITGAAPINGLRTKQGAQMAADEINAAGGVLGRQIELFVADDGGAQEDVYKRQAFWCPLGPWNQPLNPCRGS